jgi:ribosomal protein S18 acetylase RimI-like enzyme
MEIVYAFDEALTPQELAEVFRSSGLRRPVDDLQRLALMIRHTSLLVTARHDGRLVGVARCLTDFSWSCYLSCLAVRSDYQGRGIGAEIVTRIRDRLGVGVKVGLTSRDEASGFYERIGFEKATMDFIVHRRF